MLCLKYVLVLGVCFYRLLPHAGQLHHELHGQVKDYLRSTEFLSFVSGSVTREKTRSDKTEQYPVIPDLKI